MTDGERIRILIAEDESGLAKALSTYLHRKDRQIVMAYDGQEALRILDDRPVEIVVTDLVMPGVDGLQVLKGALKRDPQTLVILMTGYGSIDTAVRAMQEGAFDYKAKPFLLEEMALAIHRAEVFLRLKREKDRLLEQRDSLRAQLRQLQQELEEVRTRQTLNQDQQDPSPPDRLHVLRNRLDLHEASSSYRQWEPRMPGDEDLALLRRLLDEGAISPEQYRRLRENLSRSSERLS